MILNICSIKHIVDPDGTELWHKGGKLHRLDGPAVTHVNGHEVWYIHGHKVTTYKQYQRLTGCSNEEIIVLKLKYGEMSQ